MLDIVMPIPIRNVALAPEAIQAIKDHSKREIRIILMVDGGVRGDFDPILLGIEGCWIFHNNPSVGLNQSIREGMEECKSKFSVIIGPEVRIMDPEWIEKIEKIFHREPITGIIDTAPNTKSSTLYPVKRAHNRHPLPGCRFMAVQTAFAKKTPPYGDVDPAEFWSRMASSQGGAAWHLGGIRYIEVDHADHELTARALGTRS